MLKNLTFCVRRLRDVALKLNQDQRGAAGVENVMWIAVGVLILVGVAALVVIFWEKISDAVSGLLGRRPPPIDL